MRVEIDEPGNERGIAQIDAFVPRPAKGVVAHGEDSLTGDEHGTRLAPASVVQAIVRRFAEREIEVARNVTYRLHRDTTGYLHAARYPERVTCVELNRELLADPFSPFEEMRIGRRKVERMAEPLASAYIDVLCEGA